MHIILFVLAILAFLAGLTFFASAQSAIHEIESFILFLISAVFLSSVGIIESVARLRKEMEAHHRLEGSRG